MDSNNSAENKARSTIKKYNMLRKGDKVIVGVSGGPDSMCLLHILFRMVACFNIKLYVVHINHLLRGEEAYRDELHVKNWCEQRIIPVYIRRVDVRALSNEWGVSIEEAGRRARYQEFNNVLNIVGADKIAVAHNMDDNAETVLMRLIRGSGIDGLTGIEPVRGNIIRPIIELRREEIERYCNDNDVPTVTDSSNEETDFTRNKIRHLLIEQIKKNINPEIIPVIVRAASLLKEDAQLLEQLSKQAYAKCVVADELECNTNPAFNILKQNQPICISLDLKLLDELPIPIKKRVIRYSIENIRGSLIHIESRHVDDVMDFIRNGRTGAKIFLPDGVRVVRSYDILRFLKARDDISTEYKFEAELKIPGTTHIPQNGIKVITRIQKPGDLCEESVSGSESEKECLYKIYFDYDKIKQPIHLRNRREGDIFNPTGMKGTKKIKEYMIDTKIPRHERDYILFIATGNEIMGIVGGRGSEKFKVTNKTKNKLLLEIVKVNNK